MSKEKEARRKAAGPSMDPAAISYSMSPLPGAPPGPGNMNGNPENVTGLGPQISSMDPAGMQENLYRDGMYQYPQMGSEILNPMGIGRSGINQNTPMTAYGKNNTAPFGLQAQPDPSMEEAMEGSRLGMDAQGRGLMANPHMGMTGLPAIDNPGLMMPGALNPSMPGTSGPPMEQLPPITSMNGMTPGASKKVVKKRKK